MDVGDMPLQSFFRKLKKKVFFAVLAVAATLRNVFCIRLRTVNKKCYIFISPFSENVYPLKGQSKEGDCGALEVLEYLLKGK